MYWYKNRINALKMVFILLVVCFVSVNGRRVKKKVCIVGAGLSGLVSTKYFSEYPTKFKVLAFERNSDVGGVWIYTDSTTVDEHGLPVHSSIYKNLWTNSVKTEMIFPDYPYFGDASTDGRFLKHELVLEYLRNYTNHFQLRQYIKLSTHVEKIKPLPNQRWLITSTNLDNNVTSKTNCDFVIVGNGDTFKGHIPKIPGIENFKGQVLHSHIYRKPEPFANKTVVILGTSYSGTDIGIDVSSLAKIVYISGRHGKTKRAFPSNMEKVPRVIGAESDKLILSNATKIRADALLMCTGYDYYYPFLDKSTGIFVKGGKHIHFIYKEMININRPTMALLNIPNLSLHFRLIPTQVNYLRKLFSGKLSLPSREHMLFEAKKELAKLPPNVAPISTWMDYFKYHDDIAKAGGGYPLPWWVQPYLQKDLELSAKDFRYRRSKRLVIHENNHTVEFV